MLAALFASRACVTTNNIFYWEKTCRIKYLNKNIQKIVSFILLLFIKVNLNERICLYLIWVKFLILAEAELIRHQFLSYKKSISEDVFYDALLATMMIVYFYNDNYRLFQNKAFFGSQYKYHAPSRYHRDCSQSLLMIFSTFES